MEQRVIRCYLYVRVVVFYYFRINLGEQILVLILCCRGDNGGFRVEGICLRLRSQEVVDLEFIFNFL